jgi:hypothetical protein
MAIESEIHRLWKQITEVRENPNLSDGHKSQIILRLMEVHNRLEVESMRQQEDYFREFLKSLKLDEIGARPMTEGKLKCHLTQQFRSAQKPRSVSLGFYDSFSDKPGLAGTPHFPRAPSGILANQRQAIRDELALIARRFPLSVDDEERRRVLSGQLQRLNASEST